jgi:hypothetical protein
VAKARHIGTDFVDALPADGERRLMLAVLIDAIRLISAQQPSESHPTLLRAWVRELMWLQSDDQTYPFSFVNICTALGFDHDYVRRSVLRLPAEGRAVRLCRYAAKVGESWQRQQRPRRPRLHAVARTGQPTADTAIPAVKLLESLLDLPPVTDLRAASNL